MGAGTGSIGGSPLASGWTRVEGTVSPFPITMGGGGGGSSVSYPTYKYDLTLAEWEFWVVRHGIPIYTRGKAVRDAKYLLTFGELEAFVGRDLVEKDEIGRRGNGEMIYRTNLYGKIVGVQEETNRVSGFWYVQRDGEVLLVPGRIGIKPAMVGGDERG